MLCSGFATIVPLTLFAYAAQRMPLTVMGPLNYIVPTINFCLGWLVFHESLPPSRVVGFALVWVGLAIATADAARRFTYQGRPLLNPFRSRNQAHLCPTEGTTNEDRRRTTRIRRLLGLLSACGDDDKVTITTSASAPASALPTPTQPTPTQPTHRRPHLLTPGLRKPFLPTSPCRKRRSI